MLLRLGNIIPSALMCRISETGGWKSCISSWFIHPHCSRCLFPTVDPLVPFSSRLSSQEFIFSSSPGAQFLTLTIEEFIWNYSYSFFFFSLIFLVSTTLSITINSRSSSWSSISGWYFRSHLLSSEFVFLFCFPSPSTSADAH